jgi:hypothetical protein
MDGSAYLLLLRALHDCAMLQLLQGLKPATLTAMQPSCLSLGCFAYYTLASTYLLLLCAVHIRAMLQLLQQLRSLRHCN